MSYVVSWYEGELRNFRSFETQESAVAGKVQLKVKSAALTRVSFEPIRLMPQPVFEKMKQLAQGKERYETTMCRHKCLKRLCVPCVREML